MVRKLSVAVLAAYLLTPLATYRHGQEETTYCSTCTTPEKQVRVSCSDRDCSEPSHHQHSHHDPSYCQACQPHSEIALKVETALLVWIPFQTEIPSLPSTASLQIISLCNRGPPAASPELWV